MSARRSGGSGRIDHCGRLVYRRSSLPLLALVAAITSAAGAGRAAGDPVDLRRVVAKLDERANSWRNVHSASRWEFLTGGKPERWQGLEIHSDNLRRIRVVERQGSYGPGGKETPSDYAEVYHLYDGEMTADAQSSPNRDRLGNELGKVKGGPGYHTVTINDGLYPLPNGPWAIINPMAFMNEVPAALASCLADGREVAIEADPGKEALYRLTYKKARADDPFDLTYVATIDTRNDWAVLGYQAKDKDGRVLIESGCDYRPDENGLRLPQAGFWRNRSPKQSPTAPPLSERRFRVTEIKVNDPNFSEDVFKLMLKPDTAVSDIRYNIQYRVGDEKLIDADLKALAKSAEGRTPIGYVPSPPSADRPWRRYPLWPALGLAAIICAAVVYGNYKRPRGTDHVQGA